MIFHNSKLPYYSQLKDYLIEQIKKGQYQHGDKIPSENELAQLNGISRPTVRQALSELVQEGYLVKKRGLGTFVSKPIFTGNANTLTTFAEEMTAIGCKHQAKLIYAEVIPASEKIAGELNIKPHSSIFKIVRLRLANEEPLVIRTSLIPCSLYPNLLEEDLENTPLYDTLLKRGISPVRSRQTLQAVAASDEEAALLQVEPRSPLILWYGVVYGNHDMAVERVSVLYLGSRFRFTLDQARNRPIIEQVDQQNDWNDFAMLDF